MLQLILFTVLASAAAPLDGVWRQDCQRGSSREEAFSDAAATFTERNFWDGACSQPSVETISRGTIILGEALAVPEGARAIDFTFSSVALRALDTRSAGAWNQRGVCGFRDWAPGVEKDVTGRECDFFGLGTVVQVPRAGDRRFGIVKGAPGALLFGRLSPDHSGMTPESRPQVLDPMPYRRIP